MILHPCSPLDFVLAKNSWRRQVLWSPLAEEEVFSQSKPHHHECCSQDKALPRPSCSLSFFFFSWLHRAGCAILAPWSGIETVPPAFEVQSLNYWATRGVPVIKYLSELNYIQISRESVFLEERESSTKALDWESPLYVETYQEGQQTSLSRAMVLIIWEIFRITNYWALSQTYWIRNSGARAWKSVFKKCFSLKSWLYNWYWANSATKTTKNKTGKKMKQLVLDVGQLMA